MSSSPLAAFNPVYEKYLDDSDFIKEENNVENSRQIRVPHIIQLISRFREGNLSLTQFRYDCASEASLHDLWGFGGANGQMFLNQMVLNIPDKEKLKNILQTSIVVPASAEEAGLKITTFTTFIQEQREKIKNKMKAPAAKRSLYFLSYFWSIQDSSYPVYYPSIRDALNDLGLCQFDEAKSLADNYKQFQRVLIDLTESIGVKYREVENALFHYNTVQLSPGAENPRGANAELFQTALMGAGEANEQLTKLMKLVKIKKQLIFYGPPGTGKTHTALEFAQYLAKDRFRIVQFHPSYSYEDFVVGLKPVTLDDKTLVYKAVPGKFKKFCDEIRNTDKPSVFVIDEINRGHIPKIFGELLFLLERRNEEIELPYIDDRWSIPPNVIVIGTMNTADRSIALLDVALRRRFLFVEFRPDADLLRAWLEGNDADQELVDLVPKFMDLINSRLTSLLDRDHQLGHTYFMKFRLNWSVLKMVLVHEVIPLLYEFFFDDSKKIAEVIGANVFPNMGGEAENDSEIYDLSDDEFAQRIKTEVNNFPSR